MSSSSPIFSFHIDELSRPEVTHFPPSAQRRPVVDIPEVTFFGHVYKVIYEKGYTVADACSRLFSKADGVDKFLKFIGGILLGVRVRFPGASLPSLDKLRWRIRSINDTMAGVCNLPSRIKDFSERDENGKMKILSRPYKAISRSILIGTNACETLLMLKDWGVDFGKVASVIGKVPVLRIFASVGLNTIRQVTAFAAFTFAVVNWGMVLAGQYTSDDRWSAFYGLCSDGGKLGLIWFSASFFSLGFAALIIFTNASSMTKILHDDYKKNPFVLPELTPQVVE